MKIILGNTGRGGEQCIFSAFVRAYRLAYPQAHIQVAICPEFAPLWAENQFVNSHYLLTHEDPTQPHYMDPVGHWYAFAAKQQAQIIEFACEYGLDQQYLHAPRPVVRNIHERLKSPPCFLDTLERKVAFTPSEDEEREAKEIFKEYGPDLLVMSAVSNTAAPVLTPEAYQILAYVLGKHVPVACTGRLNKPGPNGPTTDPLIPGTIDLRGISFMTLYALSRKLKRWVGPDTATSWMVSSMPGRMFVLRGDSRFPIENTGLIVNGFRRPSDTLELDVIGMELEDVAARCLGFLAVGEKL